jgi:hypothetical protein
VLGRNFFGETGDEVGGDLLKDGLAHSCPSEGGGETTSLHRPRAHEACHTLSGASSFHERSRRVY